MNGQIAQRIATCGEELSAAIGEVEGAVIDGQHGFRSALENLHLTNGWLTEALQALPAGA